MDKITKNNLAILLAQARLEPREGDLECFGHLIDTYMENLKTLYSVDLKDEEIAPTFHPERNK